MENKKQPGGWITTLSSWSQRFIPDAFPLVLILTLLVAVLALVFTESTPLSVLQNWYDGFWSMLSFTINIVMLMFTGFLVANSKPVNKLLLKLAKIPNSTSAAVLLFMIVSIILFYIHFALGMAAAILFGKAMIVEQDKKGNKLPISLIAAAGGFCIVFQAGPTASAPLTVSSAGHFMEEAIGIIPLTETSMALPVILMNVVMAAIFILVFPRLAGKLSLGERDEADQEVLARFQADVAAVQADEAPSMSNFAEWMDNFWGFQVFIGVCGLVMVIISIVKGGLTQLGFGSVNMLFFMLALILHRTPANLTKAAREGITSVSGVVLQFPFYAGIFGILSYSGLGVVITGFFTSIASGRLFTAVVLWFSGLLNMLVPSGGSQFIVEAPYIIPAGMELGVDPAKIVNAFTCGDLLTNLIQPFWAIPVLGAYGIKFRKIFPYCLVAFGIAFVVLSGFFLLFMY